MTKTMLALTVALPLSLAGCGGGSEYANVSTTTITMNDAVADEPIVNEDANLLMGEMPPVALTGQQFADAAAASDAYERAAAEIAKTKATSQMLKDFAGMMATAHADSTAKLKQAAGAAKPAVAPDPTLSSEQQANLTTLRNATGTDFDAAYQSQQITAHQQALSTLRAYAATGEVAELKAFAAETVPVVQQHLDRIKAI